MLRVANTLCVVLACSVSWISVLRHLKNYRKPMDQRLVVRILLMVPLFSMSAYLSLYCPYRFPTEMLEFMREMYEALVIYTFYTLLTNLLGGEREIIYDTTGKPPVHFFGMKVDISDPQTFWVIKKLVMQYVYTRPIITLWLALSSSSTVHFILIVAYNISITLALNALLAFWVCLRAELEPYRVVLKFMSVKLIVFFSYWQTLALSLVHAMGWISADSLKVWGDTLLCWETVLFAYVHWRAFPASDYNSTFMFGFARLRIDAAIRDAFGINDIILDFRSTFLESGKYAHRNFDSVEAVLDHPDSQTRRKRLQAGLRYRNGGRSKYWLPDSSLQRLLNYDAEYHNYGAANNFGEEEEEGAEPNVQLNMEDEHSDGEEDLYRLARQSYGDYNYPVATVRETMEYVSFEDRLRRQQILESI